jgi:anti-sigma factor RsiW
VAKQQSFDDIDLMSYADGEGEQGGDVAAFVAASPEAARKLAAIGEIGEGVRTSLELAADEAEPALDALWARIAAGIAEPEAAAAPRAHEPAQPGLWAALAQWWHGYRGHVLTGAVAACAAAALVVMTWSPAPEVQTQIVYREAPQRAVVQPVVQPVEEQSSPPEIEELEVNGGTGSVFVLPAEGADDVSTTVIFIDTSAIEGPL